MTAQRHSTQRRRKWAWRIALGVVAIACAFGVFCAVMLYGSRPLLDGELTVRGLRDVVRIDRDEAGIPTLKARSRQDASFAMGFLHAQERFFQMDVARHAGAGRLAQLFGREALELDRMLRPHGCAATARRVVERLDGADRDLLKAYTAGVNSGLSALPTPPLEHAVLGIDPRPWQASDSVLVVFTFYMLLQLNLADAELHLAQLHDSLPANLAKFLAPDGTEWDTPLTGDVRTAAAIPPATDFDFMSELPHATPRRIQSAAPVKGSNNWAIAGDRTKNGVGLLANDMHLGFNVPNTFYRVSMEFEDGGESWRVHGVTTPGLPLVLAGTNEHIAWGLTNAPGDWLDLVELDSVSQGATAAGPTSIDVRHEKLRVRGGNAEDLRIETTAFGPVIQTDGEKKYAAQWVAHFDEAVNLELRRLEVTRTAHEALEVAKTVGMPAQNFVVADRAGDIGWTIAGPIPRRTTAPSRLPKTPSDPGAKWSGWLRADEVPTVHRPANGYLWTANARTVDGPELERLGHGFYVLGARARRIREQLQRLPAATEADMLTLQRDDHAILFERWRDQLLALLDREALEADLSRAEARRFIERWNGRASPDSVGYRLVREYRSEVDRRVFAPFVAHVKRSHPDFDFGAVGDQREGPLWALVSRRPPHALPPEYGSWEALLLGAVDAVLKEARTDGNALSEHRWGEENVLSMRHAFSPFLPPFAWLFDMPAVPLAGDEYVPLAQLSDHGPVVRFAVAPGREEQGYMQMPGGQSGHPLSPYYGAGHEQWLQGERTALLPGATRYSLTLQPLGSAAGGEQHAER